MKVTYEAPEVVGAEYVKKNQVILKVREALSRTGNRETQKCFQALLAEIQQLPIR